MKPIVFDTVIDGVKWTFRVSGGYTLYTAGAYGPGHSAPYKWAHHTSEEGAILLLVKLLEK